MLQSPQQCRTNRRALARAPSTPAQTRTQREVNLIFVCLSMAIFLSSMDTNVVSVSLPTIASNFGQFQLLPWVRCALSGLVLGVFPCSFVFNIYTNVFVMV